jgi:hypothetical protein
MIDKNLSFVAFNVSTKINEKETAFLCFNKIFSTLQIALFVLFYLATYLKSISFLMFYMCLYCTFHQLYQLYLKS